MKSIDLLSHRIVRPWLEGPIAACAVIAALLFALAAPEWAWAASPYPASGARGMVVSSHAGAARAGAEILEAGGNAVDAAVATAFAVGVTQPFSAGIGGGSFILVRLADGRVSAIDARETAPAAATPTMYVEPGVAKRASVFGPLAVAVPGHVAGLSHALEHYGTMSLAQVLAPAIRLAEEGFAIGPYHARMLARVSRYLTPETAPETVRIQFPADGEPAEVGWRLVQTDLGRTLRTIVEQGAAAFYRGEIAQKIVAEMERQGGLVTLDDLARYRVKERVPITGRYRDLDVYSYPPPSSGGVVLMEMLNILEPYDLAERGAGSSSSMHLIAEAMKLAFADRAVYLGDSDFVDVPIAKLTSKDYAAAQRARINPPWYKRAPTKWGSREHAIEVEAPGLPQNDSGTTHLSVTDAEGNAVALTMTINTPFGSGITAFGTGIVLNNEMDDFSKAPGMPNAYGLVDTRGANEIRPGKRPLSSMTPTILVKDGKPFMVTGSPGGPRIISTTLLTILGVVDFEMNVSQAVARPRFHHQWIPNKLFVEPATPADVVEGLRRRGHEVSVSERNWSSAQAIVIDPASGHHLGGSDPRSDGAAIGVD